MQSRFVVAKKKRLGLAVAAAMVAVGFAGLLLGRIVWADNSQTHWTVNGVTPAMLAERTAALGQMENGLVAIANRMEVSLVSIRAQRTMTAPQGMQMLPDLFRQFDQGDGQDMPRMPRLRIPNMPQQFKSEASGSGVVVRSDGWILTNDHVVAGADKVMVKLHDGREYEGTVRRDHRSDLAVIKINATGLIPAEFGDSDKVQVGQWAIAFGSPFSLDDTMTLGIISARARQKLIAEGGDARFYPSLLQTDASINPGNSGGPLVDSHGRVIGINVAINSPSGGSVGIGFAIPSNTATEVLNQLISKGRVVRGFLGVAPRALKPDERTRYGVKEGGALVESVNDDTPASRAGLQPEDVILQVDGKPVADDISFREMIARAEPGKRVSLLVRRNGKDVALSATLGTPPDDQAKLTPSKDEEGSGKLGIKVESVNAENRKTYQLKDNQVGAVVVEVEQGGAASDAGIEPGDVIVRANGAEIRSSADLAAAMKGVKSGQRVSMVIQRAKTKILVSVTMP